MKAGFVKFPRLKPSILHIRFDRFEKPSAYADRPPLITGLEIVVETTISADCKKNSDFILEMMARFCDGERVDFKFRDQVFSCLVVESSASVDGLGLHHSFTMRGPRK